jgi:hypothetical protein
MPVGVIQKPLIPSFTQLRATGGLGTPNQATSAITPGTQAGLIAVGGSRTVSPGGQTTFETQYGLDPERERKAREAELIAAEQRNRAAQIDAEQRAQYAREQERARTQEEALAAETRQRMAQIEAEARAQQDFVAQLKAREEANKAAEARRMQSIQSLLSRGGDVNTPSGLPPRVSYDTSGAEAARAAAFARAKDQAGQLARSSLDALRSEAASRGLGAGSTWEAARMGEALGGAAGMLGEVSREQAIADAARAAELADLLYQGGLTQRAQDIGAQQQQMQSLLSLYGQGPVY